MQHTVRIKLTNNDVQSLMTKPYTVVVLDINLSVAAPGNILRLY